MSQHLSPAELRTNAINAREDRRELINMLHGFDSDQQRRPGNPYQRINTTQAEYMRGLLESIIRQSREQCFHTDYRTDYYKGAVISECAYCGAMWCDEFDTSTEGR